MFKVLVTGSTGLLGNALKIEAKKTSGYEFIWLKSSDCDLRDQVRTRMTFELHKPDYVLHLAGKVGGVLANTRYMGEFFYDNAIMNLNVLHEAKKHNAKVVSLMSSCIYPTAFFEDIYEENLQAGKPHNSNYGYAYAKRLLDTQNRAYRQQYGCNFVSLIPVNCYGPHDSFDLENGHVIPSLIRKAFDAHCKNKGMLEIWGDGSAERQFVYSFDVARTILWAMKYYHSPEPLNVGDPKAYRIMEVAQLICHHVENIQGCDKIQIVQNRSKVTGKRKKSVNTDMLREAGADTNWTSLSQGTLDTCLWYKDYHGKLRK